MVKTASFLDLALLVPTSFRDEDVLALIKLVGDGTRLLSDNQYLCSEQFIQKCIDLFKPFSHELAHKRIRSGIKPGAAEPAKQQTN